MDKPDFVDYINLNNYRFEKIPGGVTFCFDENKNNIDYRLDSVDSGDFFSVK